MENLFMPAYLKLWDYFKLMGWKQVYLYAMAVLLILQQLKLAMDFLEPIQCISLQSNLGLLTRITHQTSSTGWYVPHTRYGILLFTVIDHVFYQLKNMINALFPPRVVAQNFSNEAKNIAILGGTPLFTCISVKLTGLNCNKPGWCLVWKRCTALVMHGQSWMSRLQRLCRYTQNYFN